MPTQSLELIFLWHMHQPDFRHHATGEFVQPWVYLHGIKDYTDMAWHLEKHPKVRAVVNLVPILIEQIEDYVDQFQTSQLRDPLLRALACEQPESLPLATRQELLEQCFRSNHDKMLEPFTPYRRLRDLYRHIDTTHGKDALRYLGGQYFADLVTWYHLAWTGETLRREEPTVVGLMAKGEGFTLADRRMLLEVIGRHMGQLIDRYRRLEQRGQIEISTTPYFHPIAPLLINLASAREAMPDAPLPESPIYPGGRQRTAWHMQAATKQFTDRFGHAPGGMWPGEGAVSWATAEVAAAQGLGWLASGEAVLRQSLNALGADTSNRAHYAYSPYALATAQGKISLFFRDDHLSDLIGFEYKNWHGRDAAQHLIAQLDNILAQSDPQSSPVVSIILDGENAWEHYPYNGFYFFEALYGALEQHPAVCTTTCSDCLAQRRASGEAERTLNQLVTGSWVYGNLSTWIGSPDKNRAWDLLCAAKQSFDLVMGSARLTPAEREAATLQLAACEGSDWYWWFGDYNPPQVVQTFDNIFRHSLTELYRLLQLTPPGTLKEPISRGGGKPEDGGAMRRAA